MKRRSPALREWLLYAQYLDWTRGPWRLYFGHNCERWGLEVTVHTEAWPAGPPAGARGWDLSLCVRVAIWYLYLAWSDPRLDAWLSDTLPLDNDMQTLIE